MLWMEKCFSSYGRKSQKVHSLKGEFLCLVYLEGQGNQSLGTLEYNRSSAVFEGGRKLLDGGAGRDRSREGVKEGAGW